jgi:zinc D-Ala-D-Ala carboxypeptidase
MGYLKAGLFNRNASAEPADHQGRVVMRLPEIRRRVVAAGMAAALAAGLLVTAAAPAGARVPPKPSVAQSVLSPAQLHAQLRAAGVLRAELVRSGSRVAAANSRLERLSAQAGILLSRLSAARKTQTAAESVAGTQKRRLAELGVQVQAARTALGQLAGDSYVRGGGPLGDLTAILEALTAPSAEQSTNSVATVHYLVNARARLLDRLDILRAAQRATSAKATAASHLTQVAAGMSAKAKAALGGVIADQRAALAGLEAVEAGQVGRAAAIRGRLLRSEQRSARAADKQLAKALRGQDYTLLISQSARCGTGGMHRTYRNGQWPAAARCPLYAAPGQSLRRTAALAFNGMSSAYQAQTGSALCVTDGYRSYAEQVAVRRARPRLAARPGTSEHGLGLAVDLCGGVQSFGTPAYLWMKRHAALYGWFHPGWAEPRGGKPEPWHWEFAS